VNSYNSIGTSIGKLPGYFNKFSNLISATNLSLTDPNRCTILHKLTNSREKLQKWITGYGFASKEGKVKKRLFSSKIGLDLLHARKLVILPDGFFYPAGENYIAAYPYNSSKLSLTQQAVCRRNRVSTECWNYIIDLIEDYYCCETVP
jgi:hypothetical protein